MIELVTQLFSLKLRQVVLLDLLDKQDLLEALGKLGQQNQQGKLVLLDQRGA
jgi:hypothetical protein